MKIQSNQWQDMSVNSSFSAAFNSAMFSSAQNSFDSFDLSSLFDINPEITNTRISGSFGDNSFELTGNHFTDGSSSIAMNAFELSNANSTLSMAGNIKINMFTGSTSGSLNEIHYTDTTIGTEFAIKGKFSMGDFDGFSGTVNSFSYSYDNNHFDFTGNLQLNSDGEISGGTIKGFNFVDKQGHSLSVNDLSIDYSLIDNLYDDDSLASLYQLLLADKNIMIGDGGDDILDGGTGEDTLIGGTGNDTYMVDIFQKGSSYALEDKVTEGKSAGDDTLNLRGELLNLLKASSIKLLANVENIDASDTGLTLLNLIGDKLSNHIFGNDANNLMDGGAGADYLAGGAGDDTYQMDNAGDIVMEAFDEGFDSINIKFNGSYNLADNIENANILSSGAFTLNGNALNNSFTGGGKASTLYGFEGDDTLIGSRGNDVLNGGVGQDSLSGGKGKDVIDGGLGDDNLSGGAGADTFVWHLADANLNDGLYLDVVSDFKVKEKDVLDLRDLLEGEHKNDLTSLLNYIDITSENGNTEIRISSTGNFANGQYDASAENAHITLANVNLLGNLSEETLLQNLIKSKNLLID